MYHSVEENESAICPVGEFTFVLHGAGGDLAKRKIIPALAHLAQEGYFDEKSKIIFVTRGQFTVTEFLKSVHQFLQSSGDEAVQQSLQALQRFSQMCDLTLGQPNDQQVLQHATEGLPFPIVHYAALPSRWYQRLLDCLPNIKNPNQLRLVLEKPLGHSGAESEQIEQHLAHKLDESQIYRIDHYLGKQAVQNLLALRLGNRIFEPLLTREHVAHIQITVAEELGVEDRADYYEHAGAINDMIQSHILQLLATVTMEPPLSLEADSLRDEKLKVLKSLKVPSVGKLPEIVLGQYAEGFISGCSVPAYTQEVGIQPDSQVETYVALITEVQTWRWAGVPILLRTGKRMPRRFAEIVIQFREVPKQLFDAVGGMWTGNKLVIHLQPKDKLELFLLAKTPGERTRLKPVSLDLDFFNTWRIPVRDAYDRLLTDILRGRLNLFLRGDEVKAQWKFVDQIHDNLTNQAVKPQLYRSGTYGPSSAAALALRANAVWFEEDSSHGSMF